MYINGVEHLWLIEVEGDDKGYIELHSYEDAKTFIECEGLELYDVETEDVEYGVIHVWYVE